MRSLYAIYRKEMGHYFVSPIAYVVVSLFLLLSGFFFRLHLNDAIEQSLQAEMQGMRFGMQQPFDAPTWILRAFLGLLALVILFFLPMLTMGVYAEERKRGTIELLMTSPIREIHIVLGKFFASLTLFGAVSLRYGVTVGRTFVSESEWRLRDAPFLWNVRREALSV